MFLASAIFNICPFQNYPQVVLGSDSTSKTKVLLPFTKRKVGIQSHGQNDNDEDPFLHQGLLRSKSRETKVIFVTYTDLFSS